MAWILNLLFSAAREGSRNCQPCPEKPQQRSRQRPLPARVMPHFSECPIGQNETSFRSKSTNGWYGWNLDHWMCKL